MSKVVIQGNASGTGDFTIAAPNSNTDRTLTLPDETGEVLVTDGTTLVVDQTNDRVGIGTTSPQELLHLYKTGGSTIRFQNPGQRLWSIGNDSTSFVINDVTAGSERMRIDPNGDLLLNTTITGVQDANAIATDSSRGRLYLNTIDTSGTLFLNQSYNDSASRYQILFYRREALVGSIQSSTSATSYLTTSDYRLKENLNAISNGIDRVKQLNPLRFNFIANPEETVDGFLAHEVDSIVPEAITGEKNALDEKGNIDPQQIDQSKLVPLLTAALKEAVAKIEALETRVTALENA